MKTMFVVAWHCGLETNVSVYHHEEIARGLMARFREMNVPNLHATLVEVVSENVLDKIN